MAIEADDYDSLRSLWDEAACDPGLEAAFDQLHEGLLEERAAGDVVAVAEAAATHLPSADSPIFDPDTFYSMHTPKGANFLFGDCSVHFLSSSINPAVYQALATISGGELSNDW